VPNRYLEHAPVAIAVVEGATHIVVYANAEFRHVSGFASSDLLGRPLADLLCRSEGAAATDQAHALPSDELILVLDHTRRENVRAREVVIAGNECVWRCTAWPVHGPQPGAGQLVIELRRAQEEQLALVLQRDIAERMFLSAIREQTLSAANVQLAQSASASQVAAEHAQSRAEDAQHEAEDANAAKAQFLANMSHELRTPLNAIGGYAQLLEMGLRGPVTEAQIHDLGRIQLSQAHLLGLINAILNYAKLEAGHVLYAPEDIDLDVAVMNAEALIHPQLRARELEYRYVPCVQRGDGSRAATVLVHADPEKLQQILINLLTNALKYTAPGGQITLECRVADGVAMVSVRDTGRGIAADKLATIFDPFVQVDRSLHTSESGVGLGLAISRELARAMGGDLAVESVVGSGSTFTLRLPLVAS
jgi:signal transduction histidine kinase